ncbi:MAG: nucleotidyltransferase family protein [Thermoflexaceae bacterium]|nr:nucleotidyltransferase family protein [Thermoflexaceae bacterium]
METERLRQLPIRIPMEEVAAFCQRHHIRRLSLFGSVLRDDFTPESDVDVLVEFEAGKTPGFAFVTMAEELSALLGREVDFLTPGFLHPRFRERVLCEAEPVYDAA